MKLILELPVISHVVKKNNRPVFINKRSGRMFPGKSQKLKLAENGMISTLRNMYFLWCKENKQDFSPIKHQISCKMTFIMDNYLTKKGEINRKIPDLSNLYELPQDCLQIAGVIENDSLIASHDGSRRLLGTENKLIIEIEEFKE